MNASSVKAIIDQYLGHDWTLRRAILSRSASTDIKAFFSSNYPALKTEPGENDALWFSRRSLPDREAWELRRLSELPFALVTVLLDSMDEDEKESLLAETESRMFDGSHTEPTSH